jgi:plasmid maintenance system killer protein
MTHLASASDREQGPGYRSHLAPATIAATRRPTQRIAWRKLAILDAAETLADLRVPPGNRLEKLRGDREGQYSIRINQQYRICFS